jgi:hypothetical protein
MSDMASRVEEMWADRPLYHPLNGDGRGLVSTDEDNSCLRFFTLHDRGKFLQTMESSW